MSVIARTVTETLAAIPPHDVQAAVELLQSAKDRVVLGGRYTTTRAEYLTRHRPARSTVARR